MIGFIKSVLLQLGIAPRVVADLEIDFETTQFIDPGVGPPQPQEFRGTIAIDDSDENKQTIDFKTTAFVFNGPLPTE